MATGSELKIPLLLSVLSVFVVLASGTNSPCVVKGQIYTGLKWYGYLLQKTFQAKNAKIEYQISYPVRECCANLLIYYDDQIKNLKEGLSCKEREDVLPQNNKQVIPLDTSGGCSIYTYSSEPLYLCTGEREFKSTGPLTWYFAVSRCSQNSSKILNMNYFFNVSGYYGECEADPLTKTVIPTKITTEPDVSVIVALGVVCGLTTIIAIVFMILFFLGRKRRKNKKGGSVTSSQATMTQDIFYVNPSLSDREHSDSQYSHSQSSGSENYYEVIPDRRSYESINTQLALQGHNIRGLNLHATHLKDHRNSNIPAYILEDYPPPPYQPPPGQASLHGTLSGGLHHRQSSAHAILQANGNYASRQGIAMPNGTHLIPNGRAFHTVGGGHALYRPTPHRPMQAIQLQAGIEPVQNGSSQNTSLNQGVRTQSTPVNQGVRSPNIPVNQSSRLSNTPSSHNEDVKPVNRQSGVPSTAIMTSQARIEPTTSSPQNTSLLVPNTQIPTGQGNQNFVRPMANGDANTIVDPQNIQLQTYGQHQSQGSGSSNNVPNGRPSQLPNGNVAKLLHDAYRIQQFETTA